MDNTAKFDDILPDDYAEVDGDALVKCPRAEPCSRPECGHALTHWASTSFIAFYCSRECLTREWDEYFAATTASAIARDEAAAQGRSASGEVFIVHLTGKGD